MKKILIVLFFAVYTSNIFSQITPDSLIGCYIGKCLFKYIEDTSWTVKIDTFFVTSFDSNGCFFHFYSNCCFQGHSNYETEYNFCYGQSQNNYYRFYSGDSLKAIRDNWSPPPPNYHLASTRFYGKKTSCTSNVIFEINNNKFIIYPNPATIKVVLSLPENTSNAVYSLYNLQGSLQREGKIINTQAEINVVDLPRGLYVLKIVTDKQMITKNVVLQ